MVSEITNTTDAKVTGSWVLYDGECPMCTDLARKFKRQLQGRGFALAPLQSPWVRARLSLRPDEPLTEMKVLTHEGRSLGGADAVVYLAREIRWAWPLCLVARLPFGMAALRRAYGWIAARRHCASGACGVPQSMKTSPQWPGWLPMILLPSCVISIRSGLAPWAFMWALSIAIYFGCKWLSWWQNRHIAAPRSRHLGFLLAWPGMDAEAFLSTTVRPNPPSPREWTLALLKTILGAVLLWGIAHRVPTSLPLARGWVGLVGLIFLLHFGTFHIVALMWQRAGVAAIPIMRAPMLATSLSDFWGRRWNLGFHQLAARLVFQPLRNRLGTVGATLAAFFVSGLIHDLVISLPAGAGYGLPTAYFTLQAAALLFERTHQGHGWGLGRGWFGWLFTAAVAAVPSFWLFHPWFVMRVIIPFMEVARAL